MENSIYPVFIDTTLDTHFAVGISDSDTVLELKEKIRTGHHECFKSKIDVTAVKVERNKKLYCLSDSVTMKSIFGGVSGSWFLSVDIEPDKPLEEEQHIQNAGLAGKVEKGEKKEVASNGQVTVQPTEQDLKRKLPEDSLGTEVMNVVIQKKKKKKKVPIDENPKQNATSGNYSIDENPKQNVPDEGKAGGVATEVVDGSTKEENKPEGSDDCGLGDKSMESLKTTQSGSNDDCGLGDKSMESLKTTQSGSNDPLKDLNTLTDKNPSQKSQKKALVKKVKKVRTRKEKSDNNSSKNVPDERIATEGSSRTEELKSSAVEGDQINFHDHFLPKGRGCVDMPNLASAH